MKLIKIKKTILGALGAAALALVTASAEATTFTFEVFDVDGLLGQTFSGSFSFDESLLTGVGLEQISGLDLEFTFLGETFTEEDEVLRAVFTEGNLLGIQYFTSDFAIDGNDFFRFGFGLGSVSYTEVTDDIPFETEAATAGALLVLGGLVYRQNRKKVS